MTDRITQIDPDILQIVGLEASEIEAHFRQQARSSGVSLYRAWSQWDVVHKQEVPFRTEGFSLHFCALLKSDVPGNLMKEWRKQADLFSDEQKTIITKRLHAFIDGFGNAALANSDWGTAIEACDITSEAGVLANQGFMEKLQNLAAYYRKDGKIQTLIDMARLLQSKKKPEPISPSSSKERKSHPTAGSQPSE
jgi:hypothetical protein